MKKALKNILHYIKDFIKNSKVKHGGWIGLTICIITIVIKVLTNIISYDLSELKQVTKLGESLDPLVYSTQSSTTSSDDSDPLPQFLKGCVLSVDIDNPTPHEKLITKCILKIEDIQYDSDYKIDENSLSVISNIIDNKIKISLINNNDFMLKDINMDFYVETRQLENIDTGYIDFSNFLTDPNKQLKKTIDLDIGEVKEVLCFNITDELKEYIKNNYYVAMRMNVSINGRNLNLLAGQISYNVTTGNLDISFIENGSPEMESYSYVINTEQIKKGKKYEISGISSLKAKSPTVVQVSLLPTKSCKIKAKVEFIINNKKRICTKTLNMDIKIPLYDTAHDSNYPYENIRLFLLENNTSELEYNADAPYLKSILYDPYRFKKLLDDNKNINWNTF